MSIVPEELRENQLLQSAIAYARRGWRVLPLHDVVNGSCSCGRDCQNSRGKHPRTYHGLKDATNDESAIVGWWTQWPTANVGIATGPDSGLFMIGPDGQEGIDALEALERQHLALPTTVRLRSGGGRHYYFRWPAEGGIKTVANFNGLPIDVRGMGGLVVAPPSLHASGSRYSWESPPELVEVAQAPEWLLDWLRQGKGTGKRKQAPDTTKKTNEQAQPESKGKTIFTVQGHRETDAKARAIA